MKPPLVAVACALLAGAALVPAGGDTTYVGLGALGSELGLSVRTESAGGRTFLSAPGHEFVLAAHMRTILHNGSPRTFDRAVRRVPGDLLLPPEAAEWLRGEMRPRTLSAPPPAPAGVALQGFRIVIDPGHGGKHSGTQGHGLTEKEINLDVARRVAAILGQAGAEVALTRSGDVHLDETWRKDLSLRAQAAGRHRAQVFVSIHANHAENPSVRGIEVFVPRSGGNPARDRESHRLARGVEEALRGTGLPSRGIKERDFIVLVEAPCPAVLVETEFLSNEDAARQLARPEFRQRIAEAIVHGVEAWARGR